MDGLANVGKLICLTAHFNLMKQSAANTAVKLGHSPGLWRDFRSLQEAGISMLTCSKCQKQGTLRMMGGSIEECYLGEIFIRKCGESIENYIQRHGHLIKQ